MSFDTRTPGIAPKRPHEAREGSSRDHAERPGRGRFHATDAETGGGLGIAGAGELGARLGDQFVFTEHSGGLVIRAGAVSELGDRNRQIPAPNYATLANALKPGRISVHGPVHGISREEFEAWLARFGD